MEDGYAAGEGPQSGHHLEEHRRVGALDVEGGQGAEPQAERGDSVESGREEQAACVGVRQEVITLPLGEYTDPPGFVRLVPKNPAPKDETVVEFLRDLLGRVERGEVDLSEGFAIHYLSSSGPRSGDGCTHHYWRHGMGMFSHLGLLTVASRDVIEKELLK